MLKITNLRNGSILSSNDGAESSDGLEITVRGASHSVDQVKINQNYARQELHNFETKVILRDKINTITAELEDSNYGKFTQTVKVIWDKGSFKRYNFYIDDNIFFLTEIHKQNPSSLFEHFYLRELKNIHQKYGTKFTLNLFYRNDHSPFELSEFSDKYKSEWRDNADWLKLSFHAFSEFPDRPYQDAPAEKLAADYDLLHSEIIRIAGEETFVPPVVIHWAMARPNVLYVLKERGVKVLSGGFINTKTSVDARENSGQIADIGYYQDVATSQYLAQKGVVYDFEHKLFYSKGAACCNLFTQDEISSMLSDKCERSVQTLSLATHEQYSFPSYFNYIPDHFKRIETAVRTVTEYGYKPVFFHEGLLGNKSWEQKI
jgi:hypothetical protein